MPTTNISVTMYDTVTNDWYELLMTYYSYMFMNPRSASKTDSIANTRAIPNKNMDIVTNEYSLIFE